VREAGVTGAGARAMRIIARALLLAPFLALSACVSAPSDSRIKESEFAVLEARFTQHIEVLASEEFGGRRPGTIGETKTLDYLRREFESAGFVSGTNDPAHPRNAPVVLVSVTGGDSRIELQIGRRKVVLEPSEATAFTDRRRGLIEGGEMVFVGYEADSVPEGMVRGRVVVMLSEPGVSPARRATLAAMGRLQC
jgi:aminopeptidase YwaD